MPIAPDTKDWTWVLDRRCEECGFDATAVRRDDLGAAIRDNAKSWATVLRRDRAAVRRDPDKWSDLEYGCHVRDVLRVFRRRLIQMLEEDAPTFENWDQDKTARDDRYGEQVPSVVADELAQAATRLADSYEAVTGSQWTRSGTRSNGSRFTVETLSIYGLHDPVHHLWDVSGQHG